MPSYALAETKVKFVQSLPQMFRTRAAGSKGNRHSGALEAGLEGPCVQGFKCHLRGPWVSPKKKD